ncbi:MAG: apolipoprotein N-acyltransferase [Deltaproteobacteria bacterium]|nr:apolipoprotein N-acyltransferase [Deltaproteobacteria bacterium]
MSMRMFRHGPAPGTLVSGILISIAFPPLEFHLLIWVALIPWLLGLRRCKSLAEAVGQGFWLNFLTGLGLSHWIVYAVPQYLGVSLAFGIIALGVYGLCSQLQFVVFAPIFHRLVRRGHGPLAIRRLVLAALLYTGLDWLIPNIFQDTLGWALLAYPSISQAAELGGAALLTFIVLTVNLLLFSLFEAAGASSERIQARRGYASSRAALLIILLLASWAAGSLRYRQVTGWSLAPIRSVEIGVVQGNVSNTIKRQWAAGDPKAARKNLDLYLDSTRELLAEDGRLDLILWPETAYPGIFRKPESEAQASINVVLDRFITRARTPFIFGAYDREDRNDRRVLRNAIFFVEPKAHPSRVEPSPMRVYHKYILFPIGEYLPRVGERLIRNWLPGAASLSRGKGPEVFDIEILNADPIRLGPSICYEDLFSAHVIALARKGAELLVTISNDSWFGNHGEPRLHLIAAKLRSIATRLPQVRATNTGYSALILPSGEVLHETDYGTTRALNWTVPIIAPHRTLMTRWGDWFGPASLILSLGGLLFSGSAHRAPTPRVSNLAH